MKVSEQRARLNAWLQNADKVLDENDDFRSGNGMREVNNEPPPDAWEGHRRRH